MSQIILKLLGLVISLNLLSAYAAQIKPDSVPDDKTWIDMQRWITWEPGKFYPPHLVKADLMLGNTVIGEKTLKMFVWWATDGDIPAPNLFGQIERPCFTPIEVVRAINGVTSVKFHTSVGKTGKEISFPAESRTYRLNICMPRTNKTIRITEYEYYDDMLTRQMDIKYYDACGNILSTHYSSYTYTNSNDGLSMEEQVLDEIITTEGCIGISDSGAVVLTTTDRNILQEKSSIIPNVDRVGEPIYVNSDGVTYYRFPNIDQKISEDSIHVFSTGDKYACLVDDGKHRPWEEIFVQLISCTDLEQGNVQHFPLNGNLKNLRVTDSGEVTVDYANDRDKEIEPGKTYSLRFQLKKLKYLER